MPKTKSLSPAAKSAINQAVHQERQLWESRRLEESARQQRASPRRIKEIKARERAIARLDRIQRELSEIDQRFFPLSKPLLAAVAEPFGRVISKLGSADARDRQIEEQHGKRPPHRAPQCPMLMRTLSRLYANGEPALAMVRYALQETDLRQIPSADGLTEENLLERLEKRKKSSPLPRKS